MFSVPLNLIAKTTDVKYQHKASAVIQILCISITLQNTIYLNKPPDTLLCIKGQANE